jgi:NAD dependent epimerase/dehydratase family enzyme
MKSPIQMGIGSPLGNGKQYVPWIHIDDLCSLYLKAIVETNQMGAYNAVAPDHKTNAEFMHLVAKTLKKPFFFPPVPAFILKIYLGERASIVMEGNKISSEKIREEGFHFKYPHLEDALQNLLI